MSKTTLKFLHLYPNMMDLYGDSGNLQILKYRAEKRGIKVQIDAHTVSDSAPNSATSPHSRTKGTINSPASNSTNTHATSPIAPDSSGNSPDFSDYDLIFLGGGSDKEQKVVARDILKHQKALKKAHQNGVFFLTICGGFQLFGKYYKDAEDNLIKGLNFFDFYTEASTDKTQRCIGNIVIETTLEGKPIQLLGFENHGGQTHGVDHPFGRVLYGNGNTFKDQYEGFQAANFLGTYLHGPLLSKNPELSDFILSYCLARQNESTKLAKLNDHFEHQAKREMLHKLL